MGLTKPSDHPDKGLVWYEVFDRMRRAEILNLLTDEVIAEHEANPVGYRNFHSANLQRVLNYFRGAPILGKYFIYTTEPWKEYRIAIIEERGKPPIIFDKPLFTSEEEAMHGVFLRRIEDLRASAD
jgi:hypothetical protein